MCSGTADFIDEFGSLNMSFPLHLHAGWLQIQGNVWTGLCDHCVARYRNLLFLFCVGFYNRFTFPYTGTSSSLMPQCLGQREQSLCSFFFFYADLKEYMSKREHHIKNGFCLGPTSVASSPPPNSQPVSMSPCMNLCKWMFL